MPFVYSLLPHQVVGYNRTLKTLREMGGGVLQVYCAWGKTAVTIKLATDLGEKTLVVVNKEFLMDQWIESIRKFTGGQARVGIIQQAKIDVTGKDFVIAMLHSLCKKEYPREIFKDFGFCVADETHHIGSEMSKALPKMACRYMLGLSATPNRKDGLSHVFYKYLGPICHTERRTGNNRVIVKRIKLKSHSSAYDTLYMSNGIKNTVGMITNLAQFETRNQLIIEILKGLLKANRKTLLLSGRREQLETFYNALDYMNIMNQCEHKITFGYYWGNQGSNKKKHRQMLIESAKCDVVLGTNSVACISDQTKYVNYLTGEEMTLACLVPKYEPINYPVVSLNETTGQFEMDRAVGIGYTESKQCYQVTHQLGQIVASYDHQFYTQRGWVRLEQLTTADYLVCDRQLNFKSIDIPDLTVDDCWLIGCLMSDKAHEGDEDLLRILARHEVYPN